MKHWCVAWSEMINGETVDHWEKDDPKFFIVAAADIASAVFLAEVKCNLLNEGKKYMIYDIGIIEDEVF